MAAKALTFSVVVCNYNGAKRIAATLRSLQRQAYNKTAYEIIVVDDCSTDESLKTIGRFKNIRLLRHEQNKGVAAARNTGLHAAKGRYVAYIDDDCTAEKHWLRELEATLSQPDTIGAGGQIAAKSQKHIAQRYLVRSGYGRPAALQLGEAKSPWARLKAYVSDTFKKAAQQKPQAGEVCEVYGANAAFPRDRLLAAGGFPDDLRTSEDAAICNRLRAQEPDKAIRFNPKAKVRHGFTPSFTDYVSKIFNRQGDTLRYYQSQRKLPPIFPFPIAIALGVIAAGLIAWWLALAAMLFLPLAVYGWWTLAAIRTRRLEPLAYTYMQACEESIRGIGLARAYLRQRSRPYGPVLLTTGSLFAGLLIAQHAYVPWLYLPLAAAAVVVPGYLLLRSIGVWQHIRTLMMRTAVSLLAGLGLLTVAGFIAVWLLPFAGVDRPLAGAPVLTVYTVGVLVLAVGALRRKSSPAPAIAPQGDSAVGMLLCSAGALLPILSLIGAHTLNNGGTNLITVGMFVMALALLGVVIKRANSLPLSVLPFMLFVISLSALWSYTARSPYLFGWDIQQEFEVLLQAQQAASWQVGATHTPYDAMLSLTVVPTMLSQLSGLQGLAIFKYLFPVLFSFVPVFLYYAYSLCVKRWIAFAAAAVFIGQFYYLQQFSALGRQQLGFLFFAGILFLLFQPVVRGWQRLALLGLAGFGLITSHYSTTYVAIGLFAGAYLASKIAGRILQGRFMRAAHLSGWMVLAFIAGAVIWYGPVTHSSAALQRLAEGGSLVGLADKARDKLDGESTSHTTADTYLEDIDDNYREERPYLSAYPDAANDDISYASEARIADRIPLLRTLIDAAGVVLRYVWWIFGAIGIGWAVLRLKRAFVYEDTEATMLAAVGIAGFILIHAIPQVSAYYNIPRLNQQALMFIALPAIAVIAWLARQWRPRLERAAVILPVALAFAIATGVTVVAAGGMPTVNLYNSGPDYNRFYVHASEVAAAEWLDARRGEKEVLFADRYANLRLVVPTAIYDNVMPDITPATLAPGAYVFANYANTVEGITYGYANGTVVTVEFPNTFLRENADMLYSNGHSEIYR